MERTQWEHPGLACPSDVLVFLEVPSVGRGLLHLPQTGSRVPWFPVLSHALPFFFSLLNIPELSTPYKSVSHPGQPSPWSPLYLLLFGLRCSEEKHHTWLPLGLVVFPRKFLQEKDHTYLVWQIPLCLPQSWASWLRMPLISQRHAAGYGCGRVVPSPWALTADR